jgi:hypothetical protein
MKKEVLLVMKKVMMVALLLIGVCVSSYGDPVQVSMQIINESSGSAGPTYAPPRPWYITQDDYVLTMPAFEDDFILELRDEDGVVVYTTYVPAGTTMIVLPSTLSGDFELRLVGDTYYYRGYLTL